MEVEWTLPAMAVVVVVAGLVAWLSWRWVGTAGKLQMSPPMPPGTFGWPVFGETPSYLKAKRSNTSRLFFSTRVAKYGEVFTTHLFGDPAVSVEAPGFYDVYSQPFFNPEGLESFVPKIDAIARDHIAKHWDGKESLLGSPTAKEFTFAVAAGLFVSLADTDERFQNLKEAVKDFSEGILQLPIDLPGTAYHKGWLGRQTMLRIVKTLIAERKQELAEGTASPRKDLLAMLLTTPGEDGVAMADEAIQDNIITLLYAGHDTSSSTLPVVLKYLHLHPHCLSALVQEQREIAAEKKGAPLDWNDTRRMKYTWQVVQETLRLQPPVMSGFRTATQDFQYAGYGIRKGWKLFWAVDRSHYNPTYFPNPESFDPSRFAGSGPPPFVWIPFGGGPHICLGNDFARTELMVFLHYIALNFQWAMVDPQEHISVDPMPVFQRGLQLKIWKTPGP